MKKGQNIYIETHDSYQLLIAECRYGYTRNNHLMPWGAYEHVKKYLPKLLKADAECALHTAAQLCDECISEQLNGNFYDGLDDENNNRRDAIDFIEWLLNFIHKKGKNNLLYCNFLPYNYHSYIDNISRHEALKYRVYELSSFEENAEKIRELTEEPISKKEADDILFVKELGVKSAVINRLEIRTKNYPVRVIGEMVRVIEPTSHAGKIYLIELQK